MGMAKHYEDDMKIREERFVLMQEDEHKPIYRRHTTIQKTYIVETTEVIVETPKCKKHKRKTRKMLCCECNAAFLFTGGEQKFYEDHKLSDPKRCPECRQKNKKNKQKGN